MSQIPQESGVARALKELEKDRAEVIAQLASLVSKLERDPIGTLNLRVSEAGDLEADPVRFGGRIISGEVYAAATGSGAPYQSKLRPPPKDPRAAHPVN